MSPALQQNLLGETYALVSITGFKDGHYTALVNSGYVKQRNNAQCLLLSLSLTLTFWVVLLTGMEAV